MFLRLEFLVISGTCVENTCEKGETLWTDGSCHTLEGEELLANCTTHIIQLDNSTTVGCARNIVTLSITSPQRENCGSGKVWSRFKRACVPIVKNG